MNKIVAPKSGLIYIENFTDKDIPLILKTQKDKATAKEKTVTIHFATGTVNGYFDVQKHESKDWSRILKNATYQDIDVLGRYAHITWNVEDFKKYEEKNGSDAPAALINYDSLVYWEQDFMGIFKYNRALNNRMYFHIDYGGASPYATTFRTAYTPRYAEVLCDTGKFAKRSWGPAHEAGHINQTVPGLKWGGTTEVTNNIHTLYVQYKYTGTTKLTPDGIYEKAFAGIIDAKSPHCMIGNDYKFHEWKLVPFWQLKLYLENVLEQEDFYKDLYEHYRTTPDIKKNDLGNLYNGALQLDFVRNVCKISKVNLLDFFEAWGFLRPVDAELNDYGKARMVVTQEQVDKLVKEIEGLNLPKPKNKIQYITEGNMLSYKE